ncbi:MAG: NAD(P)-binding domain-containing protein [Solirubrobacteraceae bacterium]|jgi:8-hydroxy-5-deazaflavin:NADPH oxidoreductase
MQAASIKNVGIIGAGRIGQVMAQIARRAGRPVVIANSHGPASLAQVVRDLGDGVSAGTVKDAAAAGIVVLAVMWPDVPQAVAGRDWDGRILIDPTNDFDPSDLDGRTSSEVVAELVAPARVVKAGNTFAAPVVGSDPHEAGRQRVMYSSSRLRWPATT